MSWTERGLLSFIPVNTQGRGLGINPFSCFAPSSGSLLAASLFLSPARTSSFGIGTSEVIRMIKGGGQCYQPSWKIRSTACVGKAQDSERMLSRQWMAALMVFDREVADLPWKRAEICAISHDRNMCFLVKGWRRFTVHWEWAGNHTLPRCRDIREESWVLEDHSWCDYSRPGTQFKGLGSHFSQYFLLWDHPCHKTLPEMVQQGKGWAWKEQKKPWRCKDFFRHRAGVLWWMAVAQDGSSSDSYRVCVWQSQVSNPLS